jgi:hypothetical protein
METKQELELDLGADAGLVALVARAASASAGAGSAVGVLDIARVREPGDARPELRIEATLDPGVRLVMQRLDVHLRLEQSEPASPELLHEALQSFGGTAYTNVVLTAGDDSKELIDLSVSFASWLPYYARNIALQAAALSPGELELCASVADRLGVSHRRSERGLEVPQRQLRNPVGVADQIAAIRTALELGARAQLYSATLPPRRALFIDQLPTAAAHGEPSHSIDLCISRGMAQGQLSTSADAADIEAFVLRRFGLAFGGAKYVVKNAHGDRPDTRLGVLGDRKGITWSVNWGHRRG